MKKVPREKAKFSAPTKVISARIKLMFKGMQHWKRGAMHGLKSVEERKLWTWLKNR
jgi:hypothetical protein